MACVIGYAGFVTTRAGAISVVSFMEGSRRSEGPNRSYPEVHREGIQDSTPRSRRKIDCDIPMPDLPEIEVVRDTVHDVGFENFPPMTNHVDDTNSTTRSEQIMTEKELSPPPVPDTLAFGGSSLPFQQHSETAASADLQDAAVSPDEHVFSGGTSYHCMCIDLQNVFKKDYVSMNPHLVGQDDVIPKPVDSDTPRPTTEALPVRLVSAPELPEGSIAGTGVLPIPDAAMSTGPFRATKGQYSQLWFNYLNIEITFLSPALSHARLFSLPRRLAPRVLPPPFSFASRRSFSLPPSFPLSEPSKVRFLVVCEWRGISGWVASAILILA
ncbi:hypothetical protein NL676_003711 [Syzygium grande]|nr:hypothetical protein NL676_003711 [Syzygium grande]